MSRRQREREQPATDAIQPDAVAAPVEPVAASTPAPGQIQPSAADTSAARAAIVAELAALTELAETYKAAKAAHDEVCRQIDEAQRLYLVKADAWDAMNRAQIAHDHAQPRVRELTKALAALG